MGFTMDCVVPPIAGHGPRSRITSRLIRSMGAACLAIAGLLANPPSHAQGHEVVPWPMRKAVPPLAGTDLDGRLWRLADLRGKAVLINFWASWCGPCQTEMPSLQTLAELYGPDKLVVLAVNFKESEPVVQRYRQRTGFSLPVLLDPSGSIARAWGPPCIPPPCWSAPTAGCRAWYAANWTGPAWRPASGWTPCWRRPARASGGPRGDNRPGHCGAP